MQIAVFYSKEEIEIASDLVLWDPSDGYTNGGGRKINYIDNLLEGTRNI